MTKPDPPHYSSENSEFGCGSCLIVLGVMLAAFVCLAKVVMDGING